MPIDCGSIKDWSSVFGTLGGAVVGAIIALVVSSRQQSHQRKLEAEKRLLERFELLHKLFSQVSSEGALCAAAIIRNSYSNIPIDSDTVSGSVDFSDLQMLAEFYAPTLTYEVNRINETWGKLFLLAVRATANPGPDADAMKSMRTLAPLLAKELAEISSAGKSKLVTIAGGIQK